MIPSGIQREHGKPFVTRRLENGMILIVDAYAGRYRYSADTAGLEIKGIALEADRSEPAVQFPYASG